MSIVRWHPAVETGCAPSAQAKERAAYSVVTSGWSISRILSGELQQVYTGRSALRLGAKLHPCRSLQRSSIYAVYPRLAIPTKGWAERAAPSSLFDLAPDGGCLAAHIAVNAGGLLHHLFTITGTEIPAVVFCGPIRQITPSRGFPGAVPCRVRTFLDRAEARPRSPNRPEAASSYTGARGASTRESQVFNVK